MTLSVIIPNYNHGRLLPRALEALLEQRPDEVVIIDDASSDNSLDVIRRYERKHSCIRFIACDKNGGVAAAIARGLELATGDLVLFAAADDFILPGLIESARKALTEHPSAAFFCSRAVLVDSNGRISGFRPFTNPAPETRYFSPGDVRVLMKTKDNWAIGPSVIYQRRYIVEAGGFDPALGSFCDGILLRELAFRFGFVFAPHALAAWIVYPESYSARTALNADRSLALIKLVGEVIERRYPEDVRDGYGRTLSRRLRFNFARLQLVWAANGGSVEGVAKLLDARAVGRAILKILARSPVAPHLLLLGYATLSMRPFGFWATISSALENARWERAHRAIITASVARAIARGGGVT